MKRSRAIDKLAEHLHNESEQNIGLSWWKYVAACSIDYVHDMLHLYDWDSEEPIVELPKGICPVVEKYGEVNV